MNSMIPPEKPVANAGRANIPTTAETVLGVVTLRRAGSAPGTGLGREEKEQLIADARAGKLVSVVLEAVTYIQRDTPNRNYVRFKAGVLRTLAPSFAGVPVLRNHDQHDTAARAGRVLSSVLEDRDGEPGVKQIRMELELTTPWAVEDAARGNIDRFSIGWHSEGNTVCSICGEAMTRGWLFTWGDCEHQLGEEYDGQICQLEYTDAVGVEVSAVNVPAVVGTEVDDVRAQLSAARASCAPKAAAPSPLGAELLAALGLADGAGEAAAVEAVGKLKAQLAAHECTRVAGMLERGLAEGRWIANSATDKRLRRLAASGDVETLEALIADLPPGGAVPTIQGLRLQSAGEDPTPRAGDELSETQRHVNRLIGVSDEAVAKLARKDR